MRGSDLEQGGERDGKSKAEHLLTVKGRGAIKTRNMRPGVACSCIIKRLS